MKRFLDERDVKMDEMPFGRDGVWGTKDYGCFEPPTEFTLAGSLLPAISVRPRPGSGD